MPSRSAVTGKPDGTRQCVHTSGAELELSSIGQGGETQSRSSCIGIRHIGSRGLCLELTICDDHDAFLVQRARPVVNLTTLGCIHAIVRVDIGGDDHFCASAIGLACIVT